MVIPQLSLPTCPDNFLVFLRFTFVSLKNTALNLAATTGHASLVTYLLSVKEQEILLNKFNQNVLDLAISNDKEEVAMAIIEHSR